MKVGILTFHNTPNYGAILQAYALSKILEELGCEAEILDYVNKGNGEEFLPSRIEQNCFNSKDNLIKNFIRWIRYKIIIQKDYEIKYNKFISFKNNNMNISSKIKNQADILKSYSTIICGSDQIWNPDITGGFDEFYYAKKFHVLNTISYAASVGDIEVIKKYNEKLFIENIENFNHISVREKDLATYIKTLTKKHCMVTLDPTLLLKKEEYDKLISEKDDAKFKYVLVYQLSRHKKVKEVAEKIAKEKNLKVIELCGIPYTKIHSKKIICDAGPLEFLFLVKNASYIVTNSFHGTAFSIIYNKNFNSVENGIRQSRVRNLLQILGLSNRFIKEEDIFYDTSNIDYMLINKTLVEKQKMSIEFLKNGLGKKDE